MERNDTISNALAIIGYVVMVFGLILGLLYGANGGMLAFILAAFTGIASGMLFVGMAFILKKLDNLADYVMEQKSSPQQSPVLEPEKE